MIGSFRGVLRDTFVYGIGDVLLRGAAFFTLPFYSRLLTPSEYGRWGFVIAVIGVASSVLALGGDSAYARFFFEAADQEGRRLVTTTWFAFLAVWSVAVVLVVLPFSGVFSDWSFGSDSYGTLFALALATAPLTLMSSMCGQALRNQFRAVAYTIVNVVSTLLVVGLSVAGGLIADDALVGIFAGGLIGTAASLPIRLILVRRLFGRRISLSLLGKLLWFGVPLVPAGLAWWVFSASDRIVLGKLSTLREVGLYSIAITITGALGLFVAALGLAWSPHGLQIYQQQPREASAFFGRMATFIVLGFGVLAVLVTTFAHDILVILSTPEFYGAAAAVGPLALGFVAYASTQVTASSISLRKKTYWFIVISWLAAALNLGLNLAFVPLWGMLGSAWASFVAYLALTLGYFVVGQRLWVVTYENRRILTASVLTIVFVVCAPLLPDFQLAASLVLRSAYASAFVVLLVVLRVIDHDELRLLGSLIRGRLSLRAGAA